MEAIFWLKVAFKLCLISFPNSLYKLQLASSVVQLFLGQRQRCGVFQQPPRGDIKINVL